MVSTCGVDGAVISDCRADLDAEKGSLEVAAEKEDKNAAPDV